MIRIGTSGWTYAPWRGVYYPRGLPQREELPYLAGRLATVEVNGTFYGPRKPTDYHRWRDITPDGFVFAIKGPRTVTHVNRLRDPEKPLTEFFDSGVFELGGKLGPVLWQTPASLRYDKARVSDFLTRLPRNIRHAMEVRDNTFANDEFIDLLTEHGVALVIADSPGIWPSLLAKTTDFAYLRLHGDTELYKSAYSDAALDKWADRVREWHEEQDVFVYFDNTMSAHAPLDAERLAERLRPACTPGADQPR
ncbi:DUF72 domain-containing protein [Actinokineospora sp. NBRC 105648]|uniref:DUF72 domain-containing protein n=1 Tax=Actinokineospora sp. NBRC 105648 TaxID=3032206 RepID=UPI0024A5A1E2|nr:DUF72 domain-containing protein [Actinokineospora sp. NBRC 105648]GLZ38781.1 hypothetical protein Acsp05_24050 [Actinokineospora sp. NBRC 105648]